MSEKARKGVHATLNKHRKDELDLLADIELENRESRHTDELNRYEKMLAERKEDKWQRESSKQKKPYIGKRKHIEKRAIVEANME